MAIASIYEDEALEATMEATMDHVDDCNPDSMVVGFTERLSPSWRCRSPWILRFPTTSREEARPKEAASSTPSNDPVMSASCRGGGACEHLTFQEVTAARLRSLILFISSLSLHPAVLGLGLAESPSLSQIAEHGQIFWLGMRATWWGPLAETWGLQLQRVLHAVLCAVLSTTLKMWPRLWIHLSVVIHSLGDIFGLSKKLHPFILSFFYVFVYFYVLVHIRARTVTYGDARLLHLLSGCAVLALQPLVLIFSDPVRQLLLWCWINITASIWVLDRATSTSDNVINIIFRLSDCIFFNGYIDPPFTVALRGQFIRVNASLTPLRIPLAGRNVLFHALVDAAAYFSGQRTLMYPSLLLKTTL